MMRYLAFFGIFLIISFIYLLVMPVIDGPIACMAGVLYVLLSVFVLTILVLFLSLGRVNYGEPIEVSKTYALESFSYNDKEYYLEQEDGGDIRFIYRAEESGLQTGVVDLEAVTINCDGNSNSVTIKAVTAPRIKKFWFIYDNLDPDTLYEYSFTIPSGEYILYPYER